MDNARTVAYPRFTVKQNDVDAAITAPLLSAPRHPSSPIIDPMTAPSDIRRKDPCFTDNLTLLLMSTRIKKGNRGARIC